MTDDAGGENDGKTGMGRERRLKKAANRPDLDADALERAHEDARFTMQQTLQSFSDLSGKAFRLIRLNALVLTLLVALASHVSVNRYVNLPSVASLLLFLGSAVFALFAYLTTTFNRGLNAVVFDKLFRYKLREKQYLNWILTQGYPAWIAEGIEKTSRKEIWIRRSLVAFIAGIAALLVGILFTMY